MSIFITLLAFSDLELINSSKIAILIASIIAGIAGYITLKLSLPKTVLDNEDSESIS
jgi:Na+:H+ antiporter, NhaA family